MVAERYAIHYESPKKNYKSYEDTSFVVGDSPVVLDVFTDLARTNPAYNGEITCDGAGSILVAVSADGTVYGDNMTVKSGEKLVITSLTDKKVRITHSGTDSSYRARFW